MILLDTSLWIALLRNKGNADAKQRTADLLADNEAVWCEMIRLELWRGAGSTEDRARLTALEAEVPSLPIDDAVWALSRKLASYARSVGQQFPPADLVVFSCARRHKVMIESLDKHFERLAVLAGDMSGTKG